MLLSILPSYVQQLLFLSVLSFDLEWQFMILIYKTSDKLTQFKPITAAMGTFYLTPFS